MSEDKPPRKRANAEEKRLELQKMAAIMLIGIAREKVGEIWKDASFGGDEDMWRDAERDLLAIEKQLSKSA